MHAADPGTNGGLFAIAVSDCSMFYFSTWSMSGRRRAFNLLVAPIPMKYKTHIEISMTSVLLVGVLGAWYLIASAERSRLTPPTDATLTTFADAMPPPQRLASISDAGETRIVWVGELSRWSFPSGPACYVFDSTGQLIQWDYETLDGQATSKFLQRAWDADQLTIEGAIDLASQN